MRQTPDQIDQKVRKLTIRRNAFADANTVEIIRQLEAIGGFDAQMGAVRPVILKYYHTKFMKHVRSLIPAQRASKAKVDQQLEELKCHLPREWRYTKNRLKSVMVYFARNKPCAKPFTLWVGTSLVERSIKSKTPLAQILRKRLKDRLDYHLDPGESQFWLQLERSPKDRWAIHAHGVFEFRNPEHFNRCTAIGRGLREVIREAAGTDVPICDGTRRQLSFSNGSMNEGWVYYCLKQRRGKRLPKYLEPPIEIGKNTGAGTRELGQRAQLLYDELRPIVTAMITREIDHWTWSDWQSVSQQGLMELRSASPIYYPKPEAESETLELM